MARSRRDPETDALWSFVTREDFIKTGASSDDVPLLMGTFSLIADLPRLVIIFWQSAPEEGTRGLLWSDSKELIRRIGERSQNREAENGNFLSLGTFAHFIEAEAETRKLLAQIL